jgi:hypothetical protein
MTKARHLFYATVYKNGSANNLTKNHGVLFANGRFGPKM